MKEANPINAPNPRKTSIIPIMAVMIGVSITKSNVRNQVRSRPYLYIRRDITILIMKYAYHGIGMPIVDI